MEKHALVTGTDTPPPIDPEPALHRIVAAGGLRYVIITSWAAAVWVETSLTWAGAWWLLTMGLGVARGWADSRLKPGGSGRLWVATASCAGWAVAPLLTWFGGDRLGEAVAVGLLCSGYTLVFTQMRSALREALIVSAPYSAAVCILVLDLVGGRQFVAILALIPVVGLALLIKMTITQMRDREMRLAAARQNELILQLEAALDEAGAAARTKASFLAVVSHELRTPLNGVLGAVQLLERERLSRKARGFVDVIAQSGGSLRDLLNDVLDLTKIEAGHMALDLAPVGMEDLLRRLAGPFEAQALAKGLELEIVRSTPLPDQVVTDPLRLGQIVHNFLSNAIKFSDSGMVRLTLSAEPVKPSWIRFRVSVEDNGVGIDQEDMSRLFQPFSQVDGSATRRFGGTGLGLNIARRLAELFGGAVDARSTPGAGSIFWVEIEMAVVTDVGTDASGTMLAAPPIITPKAQTSGALSILVVDDQPANRFVLSSLLGPLGHRVVEAHDGAAAVQAAAAEVFDLILMDVQMPVMDGLTAIREIRRGGASRDTTILVLSASDTEDDRARAFAAGAGGFLAKPLQLAETLAAIDAACDEGGRRLGAAGPA